MDIRQTHEWVRAAIAVAGALSIYLGYRLFCDLSYEKTLRNLVSGTLLALFGLGILIADVRGIPTAAPDSRHSWQKNPTREGSFKIKQGLLPERLV